VIGANFQSGVKVNFGGVPASSVLVYGGTALQAVTPGGVAGPVDVQVINPDGQAAALAGGFTYPTPPGPNTPTITSANPNVGPLGGGTAVKLLGTNFQAGTTVSFGGLAASNVIVFGGTALQATTPPGSAIGPVDVSLRTPDGLFTILSGGFSYSASSSPPPAPTSISPASGPPAGGTPVVISGSNFQSGARVTFGGVAASGVVVSSATTIQATTPAGSLGGANVQVTNPDGQSALLAGGFSYAQPSAPAPTISSLSVTFGPVAGGTVVKFFGANFQSSLNIQFGGVPAASVLVYGGTVVQATTAPGSAGTVSAQVINSDGQVGTLANAFTYYGVPSITSVSPSAGDLGGGVPVVITGTSFQQGTQVLFGGVAPTALTVSSFTQIVAAPPAHAPGAVDVVVIGPDGQQASLSPGYTYTAPAPPSPPNIFQNGFEEGNSSEYAYDSTNVVQVGYPNNPALCHSGNFCGQMTLQPGQSQGNVMWAKSLNRQPLQGYYAGWWKFPTDWRWSTSDIDMKAMILDNFPTRIYVNFRAISPTESRIAVLNNLGPQQFFFYNQGGSEPTIKADGQWHSLEVYVDQATGSVVVWFDGNLHLTVTGLNIGTVPFTQADFGAYMNGAAGNASGGPRSFYLDDVAISTTRIGTGVTNPAQTTVFSDDFETDNFSKWAGPSTLTASTKTAQSGSFSALEAHNGGSFNNFSAETYFGDYQNKASQITELYMQFDAFIDAFAQSGPGPSGNGTKLGIMIANDDFQNLFPQPLPYSPFYVVVYMDSSFQLHGELHRRTSGSTDNVQDYPQNITAQPLALPSTIWRRIRFHARLNTPGASDGLLELWVDGTLLIRYSNVNFRDSYTTKGWNMIQITGGDGAAPSQSWNQFWDNVRSYTVTQ
jgi:hypothetical protein